MILSVILLLTLIGVFVVLILFFTKMMFEGIFGMLGFEKRKMAMSKLEGQIAGIMRRKKF